MIILRIPKINHQKKGFTLIELLIVLAIFAITGTVVMSILFVVFRASSKSDKLINLKQTGNTTLMQVVKQIRYARSLDGRGVCGPPPGVVLSAISVTSILDSGKTTFICEAGPPATISSNSASLIDTNSVEVTSCSFTCSQPTRNDPPAITFTFNLKAKTSSNLVENTGSIPFQTSVVMRNINR